MISQGSMSPFHQQRWIEAKNTGSTAIPARGICQITESTRPDSSTAETPLGGRTVLSVQVPGSVYLLSFAINGPQEIAAGGYGLVTMDYPAWVATNAAYTPAYGDEWGPQPNSSLVERHRRGLFVLGDAIGTSAPGFVRVDRMPLTDLIGQPNGDMTKGTAGPVTIFMRNESTGAWEDAGYTDIQAMPLGADLTNALFCSLQFNCGQWLAACLEQ